MNEADLATVAVLLARQRRTIQVQHEAALELLATDLRAELAAEVASITERIDSVHRSALRALTDRIERNRTR